MKYKLGKNMIEAEPKKTEKESSKKINLFDWTRRLWDITCPECSSKVNIAMKEGTNDKIVTFSCSNCDFKIYIPWMWYAIKSSEVADDLITNFGKKSSEAWRWINEVKYSNPTYLLSAVEERKNITQIKSIIKTILDYFSNKIDILVLGSNYNAELFSLEGAGEKINNVLCADISDKILKSAYVLNHNSVCKAIWGDDEHQEKLQYSCAFAELLPSRIEAFSFDENYTKKYTEEIKEKFHFCMILKLIQSSYFEGRYLRKTLLDVADHLEDGGYILLSISKATSYIVPRQLVNENMNLSYLELKKYLDLNKSEDGYLKRTVVSGVYRKSDILHNQENKIDVLVDEIHQLGVYEDVIVYYGNESSFEYFISCKRIARSKEEKV